jgi:hypothetical protein
MWYAKIILYIIKEGGERRMKKPMSKKALAKEAAYWNAMKQLARSNPGMVCHK